MKGVRIHAVVRELSNENIDVIEWTDDPVELIKRALSPAKPISVTMTEGEQTRAKVVVRADEVSMAIGRGGQNIRLASKLVGLEIDVYRQISDTEEDIEIEEFSDVLPVEKIERLKNIGCDTAKAVLELSIDELSRRAGFERDESEAIIKLMRSEFNDDGDDDGDEKAAAPAAVAAAAVEAEVEEVEKVEEEPAAEETDEKAEEDTPEEAIVEEAAEESEETTKEEVKEEDEKVDAIKEDEEAKVDSEAADEKEEAEGE